MREDGEVVSGKTVARLMRRAGIVGISPRTWTPVTTVQGVDQAPCPDRVNRAFDTGVLSAAGPSISPAFFLVHSVAKEPLTLAEDEIEDAAWVVPSEGLRRAIAPVRRRLEAISVAHETCVYLEDGVILPTEK